MRTSPENILFIGAGASYGARIDQNTQPPLGVELCGWLRKNIQQVTREPYLVDLRSTLIEAEKILQKHSDVSSFEELQLKLTRNQRETLRSALQIFFSDMSLRRGGRKIDVDLGFCEKPDYYDDLIQKLAINSESWAVVSLNYDLLFEQAANRAGIRYYYPKFPENIGPIQTSPEEMPVFKPHGSINFFAQPDQRTFTHKPTAEDDRGQVTCYQFEEDGTAIPTYPIIFAGMPSSENVLTRAVSLASSKSVMANYMFGKRVDTNAHTLREVRDISKQVIKSARHLLMIGVRPITAVGDDDFVREVIEYGAPEMTYVAASQIECDEVLKRHPSAQTHNAGLRAFLASY